MTANSDSLADRLKQLAVHDWRQHQQVTADQQSQSAARHVKSLLLKPKPQGKPHAAILLLSAADEPQVRASQVPAAMKGAVKECRVAGDDLLAAFFRAGVAKELRTRLGFSHMEIYLDKKLI